MAPPAARQLGLCAGAVKVCAGAGGWVEPDYTLITGYQAVEDAQCDGLDNDCNGEVDDGADADHDGYYDPADATCVASWGPLNRLDCDDLAALFNAACILYVDARATGAANGSSWQDAFPQLESALAVARRGYEVWVAAGRYVPPASYPSAFVIGPDTALYGGFAGTETSRDQRNVAANLTLLTADVNGDDGPGFTNRSDNRANILRADSSVSSFSAIVDGFTVAGAHGGSALSISNGAAVAVARCTFRDHEGTPVMVDPYGAATTFTDCAFTGNRGTSEGGAITFRTGGTCTRCRFVANSSTGAGGAIAGNGTTIVDSYFEGNSSPFGGAISAGGTVRVLGSRFVGNSSSGNGGAINVTAQHAQPVVAGCLFTGNTATGNGGAIYEGFPVISTHAGTVVNCSFANNTAAAGGGLYAQGTAAVALVNGVLFGNTPGQIASSGANQITTTYTCIDQNVNGTSVIKLAGADPYAQKDGPDGLAGTADDDLRLGAAGSACVDSGNNAAVPADLTQDLETNRASTASSIAGRTSSEPGEPDPTARLKPPYLAPPTRRGRILGRACLPHQPDPLPPRRAAGEVRPLLDLGRHPALPQGAHAGRGTR